MERRGFRAAAALLLLAAAPATAQEPARRWSARVEYGYEAFATRAGEDWPSWQTASVSVARRYSSGSLELSGAHAHRFRRDDLAVVADAYRRLWRNAYANARVLVAPGAEVLARSDVSLELFQTVRGGFEPSLAYRSMVFGDAAVRVATAGVARHLSSWYLRGRVTYATHDRLSSGSVGAAILLRRYMTSPVEFVEVGTGTGGEAVTLGVTAAGDARVEVRRTSFAMLGGRRYFSERTGASTSLTLTTFGGVPTRTGATAGLLLRW